MPPPGDARRADCSGRNRPAPSRRPTALARSTVRTSCGRGIGRRN